MLPPRGRDGGDGRPAMQAAPQLQALPNQHCRHTSGTDQKRAGVTSVALNSLPLKSSEADRAMASP